MSTKTTNFEFIKPELTDPADITACNGNWDTIDVKLKEALNGNWSSKSTVVEDTIYARHWGDGLYTWQNANIKSANQIIELLPSKTITFDQLEALQSANIVGVDQYAGDVTFKAYGDVPTIDIPVMFIIRGDM